MAGEGAHQRQREGPQPGKGDRRAAGGISHDRCIARRGPRQSRHQSKYTHLGNLDQPPPTPGATQNTWEPPWGHSSGLPPIFGRFFFALGSHELSVTFDTFSMGFM